MIQISISRLLMKSITTVLKMTVLILAVSIISSCNQINLNDQEAKKLIVKTLALPQKFSEEINGNSQLGEGYKSKILVEAGFITQSGNWVWGYKEKVTEKGKPYLIGEGKDAMSGGKTLIFQAFDIDFNTVEGIAINKEQQTATVRFSLKATNVSPISRVLHKNIDNPRNGELVFKKFDKGWQLATEQNKTAVGLVEEIWWRN